MSRLELGPDHGSADISYEAMARSVRNRFADERPLATDIRCQGRETAWLRLFDASDDPVGRSRSWLRVSRDGSVIRTVFPDTFEPLLFAPGRVLGVKSMPDGTNRIARWTEALGD